MRPQHPGSGLQGSALQVAATQCPFLGLRPGTPTEGIIGGDAAVVVQPDDRTGMVIQTLGTLFLAPVTKGEIDLVALVENDTATEVLGSPCLGQHAEQHLHFCHALALQLPAGHGGSPAARPGCVVRPVDPAVVRVIGVEHHIEQPALSTGDHLGQAFNGLRVQLEVLADQTHSPVSFGHQHPAIGQESHRPRVLQPSHQRDDAEGLLFRKSDRHRVFPDG